MSLEETVQQDSDRFSDSAEIDEKDVKQIIESIKEAEYFDASSMAPLTPASLVSISAWG